MRARKPADGDQAEQPRFAGGKIEDGDGVLRAVADEEPLAGLIERQSIRLSAEQVRRVLAGADGFHQSYRCGCQSRSACRCRRWQPPASGRWATTPCAEACRPVRTSDFGLRTSDFPASWLEVDHRHRPFAGDVAHRVHADQCAAPGGAGDAARVGPPAAPVADVGLVPGEHDVVGGHAHIPQPQDLACGCCPVRPGGWRGLARRRAVCHPGTRRGRQGFPPGGPRRWPAAAAECTSRLPGRPYRRRRP